MRLTNVVNKGMYGEPIYVGSQSNIVDVGDNQATSLVHDKLGQLEDIEEELGVGLIPFLKEMNHLIKNSSQTTGYTTSGKKITTDYGYVEDFLEQLKEALK